MHQRKSEFLGWATTSWRWTPRHGAQIPSQFLPQTKFSFLSFDVFSILITEINEKKLLSVNSLSSQFTRIPVCEWLNWLKTVYVYIFQMISSVFFNYTLHKDWIWIFNIFFLHVILNLILFFLNVLKAFKTLCALLSLLYMGLLFHGNLLFSLPVSCREVQALQESQDQVGNQESPEITADQ